MTMATDLDLLEQYAQRHSEVAFATLVQRHVDLVYSAAKRQVRSPQLAEDVAQSVFSDLARNAANLKPGTILTAWLYQVARRTAIDVVRRESRRQVRDRIASELNTVNATSSDWTQIEPLLDEAMEALEETDRAAILLRYFENKSLREVGAVLGGSEDAAQKRVSRAVERLREFFAKRGPAVGASGIIAVLSANAVQSAPIGLGATIAAAALAGAAIHAATTVAATKAIAMTTMQKTLIAATLAVATGTGIYEFRSATRLQRQVQALQQQQAPLSEQVTQLRRQRDDATNRLASLEDQIARTKRDKSELLRLRGEVGVLRRELESGKAQGNLRTSPPLETKLASHTPGTYISKDQLAFAGYATPEAALETVTWALTHGTYEQVNEGISPERLAQELKDPKNRGNFEAYQKELAPYFKGMQILAKKIVSDDRVEIKLKLDYDPALSQPVNKMPGFLVQPMVRAGNEWKLGGSTTDYQDGWQNDGQIQAFVP